MLFFILIWIISGIVAGLLTRLVMRGRGYGIVADFMLGLSGGVIGGGVVAMLGLLKVPSEFLGFVDIRSPLGPHVLVAAIGSLILVAGVRLLRRSST
jgi:uncharacterized membrane protein YeaQ/YmgE (transglycosylase-associated protein family)